MNVFFSGCGNNLVWIGCGLKKAKSGLFFLELF
jgi:hypothetical protein